jgi:hypothetical protein
MAIRLTLYSEKDVNETPALFVMMSSLSEGENDLGLGAQRRTFHFTRDLIEALAPAGADHAYLHGLAEDLEQGTGRILELSNEQAWNIGMLPHRDGFQWVRVTISKIATGDESPRYCESYQVGDRIVGGNNLEEKLGSLEARVRTYVALDWAAIGRQLERLDESSTVQHLPDETARHIFGDEL